MATDDRIVSQQHVVENEMEKFLFSKQKSKVGDKESVELSGMDYVVDGELCQLGDDNCMILAIFSDFIHDSDCNAVLDKSKLTLLKSRMKKNNDDSNKNNNNNIRQTSLDIQINDGTFISSTWCNNSNSINNNSIGNVNTDKKKAKRRKRRKKHNNHKVVVAKPNIALKMETAGGISLPSSLKASGTLGIQINDGLFIPSISNVSNTNHDTKKRRRKRKKKDNNNVYHDKVVVDKHSPKLAMEIGDSVFIPSSTKIDVLDTQIIHGLFIPSSVKEKTLNHDINISSYQNVKLLPQSKNSANTQVDPCIKLSQSIQSHTGVSFNGKESRFIPLIRIANDFNDYTKTFGDRIGIDKSSLQHLQVLLIDDMNIMSFSRLRIDFNINRIDNEFYPLKHLFDDLLRKCIQYEHRIGCDNQSLRKLSFLFIDQSSSNSKTNSNNCIKNNSNNRNKKNNGLTHKYQKKRGRKRINYQ